MSTTTSTSAAASAAAAAAAAAASASAAAAAAASASLVPGRPRRQQQVYRRANTSMALPSSTMLADLGDSDTFVGCSGILHKFSGGSSILNGRPSASSDYVMTGSSNTALLGDRSNKTFKEYLLGRSAAKEATLGGLEATSMGSLTSSNSSDISSGLHHNHNYKANSNKENNYGLNRTATTSDLSVIDDLAIGPPRQQPKYSYLVGRSNTSNDLWRSGGGGTTQNLPSSSSLASVGSGSAGASTTGHHLQNHQSLPNSASFTNYHHNHHLHKHVAPSLASGGSTGGGYLASNPAATSTVNRILSYHSRWPPIRSCFVLTVDVTIN